MTDHDPQHYQELGEAIKALAYVKNTKDEYKPMFDDLAATEKEAKAVVADHFAATKGTQIKDLGIVVYQTTKTTHRIDDINALRHVLEERGDIARYTTVDTQRVIDELGHIPAIANLIRTSTTTSIAVKADSKGSK